jgi:hypothetical protein
MKLTGLDLAIVLMGLAIAAASARDYAGGYNDGGRLATVESLVDHRTWQIDDSIFSRYGEGARPEVWGPLGASAPGALDKLLIGGHYYSDKPPVTAVLMAADYQVIQGLTGLVARDRPNAFCYWITLTSSGLAYVVAVWCVYRIGCVLALPTRSSLLVAASFGLATLAPAYARQVNASIVLLADAALLLLVLLHGSAGDRPLSWSWLMVAGTLAGFGYSTDLGGGLVLLGCVALWVFHGSGYRITPLIWFGIGALPWLVGHHILTYKIGGTFGPMGTVPEYFQWPNSPFTEKNLTGVGSGHQSLGAFVSYAGRFLFGNKGFLYHNPELFLAIPAFVGLVRTPRPTRPLLVAFGAWAVGTWLLYAIKSKDFSGYNVSIRWMVPTLVAGYFILAVQIRESPRALRDFVLLTLFALPISTLDWTIGTWTDSKYPWVHAWIALALGCWLLPYLARAGRLLTPRRD